MPSNTQTNRTAFFGSYICLTLAVILICLSNYSHSVESINTYEAYFPHLTKAHKVSRSAHNSLVDSSTSYQSLPTTQLFSLLSFLVPGYSMVMALTESTKQVDWLSTLPFHSERRGLDSQLLRKYLIPADINTEQATQLSDEIDQLLKDHLRPNEDRQTTQTSKRMTFFLSNVSDQLRVVQIKPDNQSAEDTEKQSKAFMDSLLQVFISLLDSEQLSQVMALAAGAGDGGDDDGDYDKNTRSLMLYALPEFATTAIPFSPLTEELRIRQELLAILQKRLQQAILSGDKNLQLILRDRIMLIEAGYDELNTEVTDSFISGSNQLSTPHSFETLHYFLEVMSYKKDYGRQVPKGSGEATPQDGHEKHQEDKSKNQPSKQSEPERSETDKSGGDDGGEDNSGGGDEDKNPEEQHGSETANVIYCTKCGTQLSQTASKLHEDSKPESILCDTCLDTLSKEREENPTREDLIDAFLAIPLDDFRPIPQLAGAYMYRQALSNSVKTGIDKLHAMLTLAPLNYLEDKDKEKTKKEFLEAADYASNEGLEHFFFSQFKQWLTLHDYLMAQRSQERNFLLEAKLRGKLHTWDTSEDQSDLLTLRFLFSLDLLLPLKCFSNLENAFLILNYHQKNIHQLLLTPVSFTVQDGIRFLFPGESEHESASIIWRQKGLAKAERSILFCFMTGIFRESKRIDPLYSFTDQRLALHDRYLLKGSDPENYFQASEALNRQLISIAELVKTGKIEHQDVTEFYATNKYVLDLLEVKQMKNKDNERSFYSYLQAHWLKHRRELPRRLRVTSSAQHFSKSADHWPGGWHNAYRRYIEVERYDKAREELLKLADYWRPLDENLSEYWTDVANQLQQNDGAEDQPETSRASRESAKSIEEALKFIEGSSDAPAKGKEKTRKKRKKKGSKKSAPESQSTPSTDATTSAPDISDITTLSPVNTLSESSASASYTEAEAIARPVIKASSKLTNRDEFLTQVQGGGWRVKTRSTSRPIHERLLYDNWSPLVKRTLESIRHARSEKSLEAELTAFKKIFNHPEHKIMVGIERIWEEAAWTYLHKYDESFATGSLPLFESSKEMRRNAQFVRTEYALPALAARLGLGEINTDTGPEEFYRHAESLLSMPEYFNPASQDQLRHRLRALFSTLGHTYSLEAMATPSKSKTLGEKARTWFQFKRIDHNYVPPVRHH